MERRKAAIPHNNLTQVIMLRVSESTWKKLEKIRLKSNCRTRPEITITEQERDFLQVHRPKQKVTDNRIRDRQTENLLHPRAELFE